MRTITLAVEYMGADPTASAITNSKAIQDALTQARFAGGGCLTLTKPGTYTCTDSFTVGSNTAFKKGPGVTLQTAAAGAITTLASILEPFQTFSPDLQITISGSRALVGSDNGATLVYSGAGAITLTMPSGLPLGFGCAIAQMGAGQVTITGTTINNASGFTKTSGQYAVIALVSVGTDSYLLTGSAA